MALLRAHSHACLLTEWIIDDGNSTKFRLRRHVEPVKQLEVGVVLYPAVQQASVLGLTDLFCVANACAASYGAQSNIPLRVTHWEQPAPGVAPVRVFDNGASRVSILSALILPPSLAEPTGGASDSSLTAWRCEQHGRGVVIGSVCAGAFLLAETGLMTGRPMTTHWTYADLLKSRFPDVNVDVNRLIIDDGDVISAGGLMSWTDLGLRLVDRLLGPTVMLATARMMLVDPPGREQRYYSVFSPRLSHGDAAVLKVQHWLQATQGKETRLQVLAEQANLEERTLLRRFQKATGMTTTEYCQHLRVGRAKELLQFDSAPIDRVAWEVGYSDPGAFRKIFARIAGLSPSAYRRRFSVGNVGGAGGTSRES
ncbi:HTH-type transcriptional activator RhaR [Achromobacter piechaudii]|uniref:Transcriptional regulator GlxA family with amidase domain n=2 Tax=Achromobacter TaxID=222 RepID=A0ABX9G220_9BURK|nr:transcriptional regulator GlxA family with amidase domain [Achromobacter marplatensis]CAB3708762.1 HTH-type transcriptional activator RhaR [Achromobacter marplatensis]CAB3917640.1 HTH-type transcriptional activator RhaR [Achromobacter pulmonis]CAB3924538.1 HTH-type transcriptional activator RhaR [Achromobacter piechaudii]CAB3955826.1 HTH-type transcriptional activator RhaR [Achromobacter piechaudii]